MYALDGVVLQNPDFGWRLKRGTNPWTGIGRQVTDFNASGRDGTIQTRGFISTPTLTLIVTSPKQNLTLLRQLLRLGSVLTQTGDTTRAVVVELVSLTPEVLSTAGGELHRLTAVYRLPSVYWRDVNPTTQAATQLTANGQKVTVFPASTGPVRDALVSVRGSITGVGVIGSNGTYFAYAPSVPAGQWLTFDSVTGRAWTGSAAFTLASEVTGQIANGSGPYFLEFAGTSLPTQPGTPVTVTWAAASGAMIMFRGRNAYDQ